MPDWLMKIMLAVSLVVLVGWHLAGWAERGRENAFERWCIGADSTAFGKTESGDPYCRMKDGDGDGVGYVVFCQDC